MFEEQIHISLFEIWWTMLNDPVLMLCFLSLSMLSAGIIMFISIFRKRNDGK